MKKGGNPPTPSEEEHKRNLVDAVSSMVALDFQPLQVLPIHSPAPRHPWRYNIIGGTIALFLTLVALLMMSCVVVPRLAGWAVTITIETTMHDAGIDDNTALVVKPLGAKGISQIKENDIVMYLANDKMPYVSIGRVQRLDQGDSGEILMVKGDSQKESEAVPVNGEMLRGKVLYHVPWAGILGRWFDENVRSILLVMVASVLFSFAGWEVGTALINRRDPQAEAKRARLRAAAAAGRLEALRKSEGRRG